MAAEANKTQLVEVEKQEITVRPIVTKDLFFVIKHVVPHIDIQHIRELFNNVPKNDVDKEAYFRSSGIEMMLMVLNVTADEKVQEWIADLAGMTLEQFLDSDIDTSFKIVSAIASTPDIRKVFTTLLT